MVAGDAATSPQQGAPVLLRAPLGATKDQAFDWLKEAGANKERLTVASGLDAGRLACEVDAEVADQLLAFCAALPGDAACLRLAHKDLGSGNDTEQLLFDRLAEREAKEAEKRYHEKAKRESSNQKDFAVSAGMRRKAEAGIAVAVARLTELEEELQELARRKAETPWHALFRQMEARSYNAVVRLDLSNCGLHATGLVMLSATLLELEQRAESKPVSELVLDGNAVGDVGMSSMTTLLRLSKGLQALSLRSVGLTERGVSQVLSGLVNNKLLLLLDLRSNGLSAPEVGQAAVEGVRRFNNFTEILL